MLQIWSSSPKTALAQRTILKMGIDKKFEVKRLLKMDKLLNVGNPENVPGIQRSIEWQKFKNGHILANRVKNRISEGTFYSPISKVRHDMAVF